MGSLKIRRRRKAKPFNGSELLALEQGDQPVRVAVEDLLRESRVQAVNRNASTRKPLSVAILGDSIPAQTKNVPIAAYGGNDATDDCLSNFGFPTWWLYWAEADIEFTIYAVASSTTAQVVASQLPQAIAAKHDIYLDFSSINDGGLTPQQTLANKRIVRDAVLGIGARCVFVQPTPNASFDTTRQRFTTIMEGLRQWYRENPGNVRTVECHHLNSDPASTTGGAYTSLFDALTYDANTVGTHPNCTLAAFIGLSIHEATQDWTGPYYIPRGNGDLSNLLINSRMGGTTGTVTNLVAGSNSVAPLSWTIERGASANTLSKAYKGSTLTALWRRNTAPGKGRRVVLPARNEVHYIALSDETIPVGGTPPSSTTLWEQTRPDPAGPVFLTVPANDRRRPPDPGDEVIIDMRSSDTGADRFVRIWQEIPAVALRGRTLRAGIRMESLGSPWAGVQLQVSQLNVNTKIKGHFGMGAQSFFGAGRQLHLFPFRYAKGLVATNRFTVDAACTRLFFRFDIYGCGDEIDSQIAVRDAFLS